MSILTTVKCDEPGCTRESGPYEAREYRTVNRVRDELGWFISMDQSCVLCPKHRQPRRG